MQLEAQTWAIQQWAHTDLGDTRRTRQAVRLGVQMAAQPEASLPHQVQSPAALKAAYRLLNNPRVSMEALLEPHWNQTRSAARQASVVLLAQDTTVVNLTAHPSTTGLGPVGPGKGRGLLLHSCLAVLPETRTVLGVAHTQVILRQEKPDPAPKWSDSPEGQLWESTVQAIGCPPPDGRWVYVSDAGSDIFMYLSTCRAQGADFVVRASRNRKLRWEAHAPQAKREKAQALLDYVRSLPAQPDSAYPVPVPATATHPAREAHVVLQWTAVTLPPPREAPTRMRQTAPLSVWVLRVWEPHPPRRTKRLEWVLLSSQPITTEAEAQRVIGWYTCRWLCEDYYQCLKTGCQVERTQLDDGADIRRLLGFQVPLAVRLLQLRQAVREHPDVLAETLIDPWMVQILQRKQGRAGVRLTLGAFWQGVARLGGFQGRRRDGAPGWRTIWRGWHQLSDLTEGARLVLADDTS